MEHLIPFTLFGSGIAFGILLIATLIFLFISDAFENGVIAFITMIIFCIFAHFWSDNTFHLFDYLTLKNVLLYIIIGFIFSLIRTYFKGQELKKIKYEYHPSKKDERDGFDLREHVFRWWFLFPFSIINWFFGSLLGDVFKLIYTKIESVYLKIFNL